LKKGKSSGSSPSLAPANAIGLARLRQSRWSGAGIEAARTSDQVVSALAD
jgi:hypothetical protein